MKIVKQIVVALVLAACVPAYAVEDTDKPEGKADIPYPALPEMYRETLLGFEKENKRLFIKWAELHIRLQEVVRMSKAYGTEARREWNRRGVKLQAKAAREEAALQKLYHRLRDPIAAKEEKLLEKAYALGQKEDTGDAKKDQRRDDQISRLREESDVYSEQLHALSAMREVVESKNFRIPDRIQIAGLDGYVRDDLNSIETELPKIIDAKIAIKDLQADIEALKKREDGKKLGTSDKRKLATAETKLERVVASLEREVERASRPLTKKVEQLKKKIAVKEKSIAAYQKRKRDTERLEEKLYELKEELSEIEAELEICEKLVKPQEVAE